VDVSASVDGPNHLGNTAGESDDFTGSCGFAPVADQLLSFVAPYDGDYLISTDHPGTGFDTLIYAFTDCNDAAATELDCNDDTGGLRSQIVAPAVVGELIFIAVEGFSTTGSYELSIESIVCGDGRVAGNEECDDGNTSTGDGCDDDCLYECNDDGFEDNDDESQAATIAGPFPAQIDAILCPADGSTTYPGFYMDWFSTSLGPDEFLSGEIAPGPTWTNDCMSQNLRLEVWNGTQTALLAQSVSNGVDCPSFGGVNDPSGEYLIVVLVDPVVGWTPPQDYGLSLNVLVPVCGNGTLEGNEECDDGNLIDGDGCQANCRLPRICGDGILTGLEECDDGNLLGGDGCTAGCIIEDATCPVAGDVTSNIDGATVLGNTSTGTDDHDGSCVDSGAPELVYTVRPTQDMRLEVSLDHPGTSYDTGLYVRTDCLDRTSEVACNDDAQGLNSVVRFDAVSGLLYSIVVAGFGTSSGSFEMGLRSAICGDGSLELDEECDDGNLIDGDGCDSDCTITRICGDGVLAPGEQCDDGNSTGGDGCSATCFIEDAACPIVGDITGNINGAPVVGDTTTGSDDHSGSCVDTAAPELAFTVRPTTDGRILVSLDNPGTTYDTGLYVRQECIDPGSELACNDDYLSLASALSFWAEAGEDYWIIVTGFSSNAGPFEMTLIELICGDGQLDLGEECDDGNATPGDGCDDRCLLE
jgi:cysteine-rich repeat protein